MGKHSDKQMHPNQEQLISIASKFLAEVENLTPGKDLEKILNEKFGPGTKYYDTFHQLIQAGIENEEGWVATTELDGPKYRRSRICGPSEATRYLSITTVYMESEEVYEGQYHKHPYGEINCVLPLTGNAEILGMQGFQGAGWTSPGPGTHHYPTVRGGALVALFFLPAGRISYQSTPTDPQPHCV